MHGAILSVIPAAFKPDTGPLLRIAALIDAVADYYVGEHMRGEELLLLLI